ncbi:MAG: hypothetical protein SO075_06115 [Eubacteriales bacterium]|nr:hypothetical protein [Eubacteriales bacterium]
MKNIKKLLSLLLCGIMLFGMFPASLFAAGGDTGDGSGTISETFVPEITWKRTFEYEHRHDTAANQHTNLGGLYAGDKTAYLSTESKTESNVTTYKNKVHWDWATLSGHFNGRTDDVDDSAHKVWDYGHTDVQYADPVKASITNPIASSSQIGGVGIIPYAPSAGEQAIFAATWNNRAAQDFKASSVDGTGIYYSGNYVSVKKGQMDIGYGKKSNDSTISTFSGKSYTARRFSGSFVWPKGYTLSDSIELVSKNDSYYQEIYDEIEANPDLKAAFGGKKVVAINDDMFVFVYKDGEQLTENNYSDYLAFFAGTAGKGVWSWPNADPQDASHGGSGVGWGGEWNVTEPATYGDKYASKAFYKVLPNLDTAGKDRSNYMLPEKLIGKEATSTTAATAGMMALSDYWYSFMDGNAISTVLNNKYGTTGINAGDTVHIDIYCIDMDKVGGMDELEIRLTRQKPTTSTVKVRYWLNEVGEITGNTNYLGETTMTGQTIGSQITLVNGTDVNQLNHKRAAAIPKANGDVSDGVQIELPFTVTEKSEDNIINVVYVPAGNKVVHLWAGSLEVPYNGSEHVVHDVKITQDGCNDITVPDSETNTWCELNDRNSYKNKITDITAQRKEIYPGIYVVDFARTSKVESYWGAQLNNYSIIYHPGTLKITYAPPEKTFVYDFGVQNSYKLTDVEKKAVGIKTVDETVKHVGFNDTDKSILYTPQSVNNGETIQTKLVFTGNYITEATSITFLPATNVLYEENFMTNSGTHGEWTAEGTNNTATVVNDNEKSVYGYADAYKGFANYSNGGALKAKLDLKGGKRAYTTDAVEFSFSGTGFDIISECGTDTGLLLVALSKEGSPFKVYIVDTYFCGDNSIGGNPPIPPIITGSGILDYQVPVVRAMNLERADYSVRILGYLTNTSGAIVGPANPTPLDGGETGAEGSTRGANGVDTNRILREAGLKEFIGCEVETSFMDENSVLNGGTGIAAKNSQSRTFGKRDTAAQRANVYLDAFRVYQPLELESEANYADNEKGLKYAPVYDYVKNSAELTGSEVLQNSMVYVEYDGDTGIAHIANYQERGPQNEVYLTNGNYIGFALEGYTEGKTVMISAKAVAGDPVLGYLDTDTNAEGAVTPSGMKMTEMYYDVTACVRRYGAKYMLVLGNIADADAETRSILSVSGIKLADGIIPATSTQIAADIASLVTLAYQPVEEPVFTPERFELRYSGRALAGWFTSISVKTSTDVDHVSVYRLADDGSLVPVRENMRPMNSLFTYFGWMDYYAFSLTVRAPRRGMTDTYYIFAYDANGVASEPAIASITGR